MEEQEEVVLNDEIEKVEGNEDDYEIGEVVIDSPEETVEEDGYSLLGICGVAAGAALCIYGIQKGARAIYKYVKTKKEVQQTEGEKKSKIKRRFKLVKVDEDGNIVYEAKTSDIKSDENE